MGARIEIWLTEETLPRSPSLPSWERGLKSYEDFVSMAQIVVAPLVGARIEISLGGMLITVFDVAPLVGARIEI